jgi:hypothetical protein
MWRENRQSILIAGIPSKRMLRGDTRHIEHDDQTARVEFDGTGEISHLHTPQDAFRRVHEVMHANRSYPERLEKQYSGVIEEVWNIAEDCYIHVHHWPWLGKTPPDILNSARKFLRDEVKEAAVALATEPKLRGEWPDFAMRLRQAAIRIGLGEKSIAALNKSDFKFGQRELARRLLNNIVAGEEGEAARTMQSIFFEAQQQDNDGKNGGRTGKKDIPCDSHIMQPPMEVINLPLTEVIPNARIGYRRATSGARIHRPSLRKPILPQRLFMRRAAREAGGTILVDASGSMGDFSEVTRWIEKAPFGTIAYYAGGSTKGWLWICAKNGRRARKLEQPPSCGNTVDGLAINWLLSQPTPHVMVTDRGFCGAPDSQDQVFRLARLERQGKITVHDYAHSGGE